jgi:hypothetical protein
MGGFCFAVEADLVRFMLNRIAGLTEIVNPIPNDFRMALEVSAPAAKSSANNRLQRTVRYAARR